MTAPAEPFTGNNDTDHRSPRLSLSDWLKLAQAAPARLTVSRLWRKMMEPAYASPVYGLLLMARPRSIETAPPDPWPGDSERGAAILRGEFTFGGRRFRNASGAWPLAGVAAIDDEAAARLHSFDWLRDLHAVGNDVARKRARALVDDWMERCGSWSALAWRPDVTGLRLANWLAQHDFFCASAPDDFRRRFFHSISRQTRHLTRVLPRGAEGSQLIAALKGLIYVEACLPLDTPRLDRVRRLLTDALEGQVFPDGGHVERSPSQHLNVLRHLIDMRATLVAARETVPEELQSAIDRMSPMLRFYCHGDGGLALFNDSVEEAAWIIDLVLQRAEARGKPFASAPHTGFQRLAFNRTRVLADTGAPPPAGADHYAHAGTLSFEFSVGRERIVVNCGAGPRTPGWRQAARRTAAHSTLSVCDADSSDILPTGAFSRRSRITHLTRNDSEDGAWLEAQQDGFRRNFDLMHTRRLWLDATGWDFRGEDRLEGPDGAPFVVRFHLHPRVRVSLSEGGHVVLLRPPSGGGWRFRAKGADIRIEESVYLGQADRQQRAEQIVLAGTTRPGGAVIKWALQRVTDKN